MEGAVADAVRRLMSDAGTVERVCDLVLAAQDAEPDPQLAELEDVDRRIEAVERELGRLVDLAAQRGASDALNSRMDEREGELAELRERKAQLAASPRVFDRDRIRFWLRALMAESDPAKIIDIFVSEVVLQRSGRFEAYFTFDEPPCAQQKTEPPTGDGSVCSRMVARGGVEPSTRGFSVRCSTN